MSGARQSKAARRLAAELELERAVHGLMVHELGNPLQSLLVSIELSRDDLAEAAVDEPRCAALVERPVERLDRALVSVERLREVLLSSGRLRAGLAGQAQTREHQGEWGPLLDDQLGLIARQLTQLRAGLTRATEAIDGRPVAPGYVRAATLSLLLGACRQIREARDRADKPMKGMTLALHGRVLEGRTCLLATVHGPAGPVELAPEVRARVEDLLGDDPRSGSQREGHSLVIWSE